MATKQEIEKVDISQLLKEAGAEIDSLIKSEREKLEALKKKEESSVKKEESSMKKEESSVKKEESSMKKEESSVKKDEGSGYQNQAPEASASQSASPDASATPPPADGQQPPEQGEDLHGMVSSLDDEMLQELMQVVQMEMETRHQQGGSPDQSQSAPPPPDASAQPPAPGMEKMAMAYKAELDSYKDRLQKSEQEAVKLQNSFTSVTELLDKMINRPVSKAVTDIRNVDYIDKGEKDLKKNETTLTDADLKKKANEMAKDNQKLGALSKSERETLSDFLMSKQRTPEIVKLILK